MILFDKKNIFQMERFCKVLFGDPVTDEVFTEAFTDFYKTNPVETLLLMIYLREEKRCEDFYKVFFNLVEIDIEKACQILRSKIILDFGNWEDYNYIACHTKCKKVFETCVNVFTDQFITDLSSLKQSKCLYYIPPFNKNPFSKALRINIFRELLRRKIAFVSENQIVDVSRKTHTNADKVFRLLVLYLRSKSQTLQGCLKTFSSSKKVSFKSDMNIDEVLDKIKRTMSSKNLFD